MESRGEAASAGEVCRGQGMQAGLEGGKGGEHLAAGEAAAAADTCQVFNANSDREPTTPITARAAAAAVVSRSISSALPSGGFGTHFQPRQQQERVYVVSPTPGSAAGAFVVEESDRDSSHPFTLTQVPRGRPLSSSSEATTAAAAGE